MQRLKSLDNNKGEPLHLFRGGMRYGSFNATMPLVRMEMYSDSVRLSSTFRMTRKLIPILTSNYSDITYVQAVSAALGTGIRIRFISGVQSVVFWTSKPVEVLLAFRKLGVEVNPETAKFHFSDPER